MPFHVSRFEWSFNKITGKNPSSVLGKIGVSPRN